MNSIRETFLWRLQPVRFLLLILWVFAVVFFFHHRALGPELRYTRVAEGNISHAVHSMWYSGMPGYIDVVRNDAKCWGRVRPLHWLYHSVPFFLTIVRNGDFFHGDADVAVRDRINGDLQTHTFYLVLSLVIAISALSWFVWRVTGAWWSALLLPLYAVSNSTVCENFLVNYCDGGEIGQLLFISLYLASLASVFSGKAPVRLVEVSGVLFLFLAYAMKETSIVLLPVVLALLALMFFCSDREDREFRRFALRHAALISILSCGLLAAVYTHRQGAYVSQNYQVQSSFLEHLQSSLDIMCSAVPVLPLLLIGGLSAVISCIWVIWKHARSLSGSFKSLAGMTAGVVFFAGISAGFWAINLPWAIVLAKYYLPVFVFASVAALLLQVLLQQMLRQFGFRLAGILWIAGSLVFMTKGIGAEEEKIQLFYKDCYEYRKVVPFISKDISDSISDGKALYRAHIVDGQLFQENALPFWRQINRFHELNIAHGGKVVSAIHACERDYFRRYPGRPAVEVTLGDELLNPLNSDGVYLLGNVVRNETQLLNSLGYTLCFERSIGSPGLRVGKYVRSKP